MKRLIYSLLAFALILSGCKPEEKESAAGSPVDTSYNVSFEGVSFLKGDMLSLLNAQYTGSVTATASGESVEFSGKAPKLPSSERYIAVYPYSEDYVLDGGSFEVVLPSAVTPEAGMTVGAVGAAYADGKEILLKPVTAFLRFGISRDDISSLVFRCGDKKYAAGTYKVNFTSDGTPRATVVNGAEALVVTDRLLPGSYCIGVAPEKINGYTVDITAAGSTARVLIDKSMNLASGTTLDLGTIDEGLSFDTPAGAPELELIGTTATNAAVTWSISGFNDVYADIAQKWSAGIYNDEACSDLRVSWDFPAALWNVYGGNTITSFEGPYSPRFIFTSLEPSTDYYVKVWYTDNPSLCSTPLKVSTSAAAFTTLPEGFATEGSVILQEDFSELPWGGDVSTRSFGISDESRSSAPAFDAPSGINPVGGQTIDGFNHKWYFVYPGTEIGLFNTLRGAVSQTRLKDWTSMAEDNSDGKALCRPGYVKLGSSSKTGAIVTPALNCLEHRALVRLSFKAHPYRETANDPLTASVMVVSSSQEGVSVLTEYSIVDKVDFTLGENHEWKEFSYDFLVQPGSRLAVSSRRVGTDANQRRILVDDIKVELLEYRPQVKVFEVKTQQDMIDFLSAGDTYEPGETVTLANDLDLSGVELPVAASFEGVFDGQGHALRGWTNGGHALFTSLGTAEGESGNGTVKNLVLDASCTLTLSSEENFGFIARTIQKSGVVDGVTINASPAPATDLTIDKSLRLGTIAGVSYGLIQNCVNNGALSITAAAASQNVYMGGIVGFINSGDRTGLYNNTNNGDVSYRINNKGVYVFMGGISAGTSTRKISEATDSRGTIDHCTNTGNISYVSTNGGSLEDNAGTGGTGNYIKVGGVVGYFEGNMTDCTNGVSGDASRGNVSVTVPTSSSGACATGASVGGVAAFVMRNVTGCTNYGKVYVKGTFAGGTNDAQGAGISAQFCTGGIVAQAGPNTEAASYMISDCRNYGELDINSWMATANGTAMFTGGIVGWTNLPASDCINEGKVGVHTKMASSVVGGICGQNSGQAFSGHTNRGEVNVVFLRDDSETSNKQCNGTYQRVGGILGYSAALLSGSTNYGKVVVTGPAQGLLYCPLVGGVAGQAGTGFESSNNEGDIEVNIPADGTNGIRVGGVVGHLGGIAVDGVSNKGAITVKAGTLSNPLAVGGVIGWKAGGATLTNLSALDATKSVSVHVENMNEQFFVGGVVGRFENTTAKTSSGLKNYKPLSMTVDASDRTNYSYIGGVAGCDKTGQTFSNCENYGDISVAGKQKLRIAGISAYTDKAVSGCNAECDITATLTGKDYSEVGGIIGYTAATGFTSDSFSGSINTSASTAKVYTGGILGKSNGNQVFNGCSFSGTLTGAAGNNVPGLYVGGMQSNGKALTFGASAKCTVGAGSKVNGTTIEALSNENLVSQSSDDGTYTSTGTLTNIVIE